MPDFARKSRREPVATIRMTTKTKLNGDVLGGEETGMQSKIDPAKYLALLLGSNISLTDSLASSLRLSPPQKSSEVLLQELSDVQISSSPDQDSWSSPRQTRHRTLGTRRSGTAPLLSASGRKMKLSRDSSYRRPSSSGSIILPTISPNSKTKLHGYEINGIVDADATVVDADAVLDQGSELALRDLDASYASFTRAATPPVPSADVLSTRQLKLIGTHTDNSNSLNNNSAAVDKALSQFIVSKEPLHPPKEQEITPSDLFDMVGDVGERMLVNRARLLLMQHETGLANDGNNANAPTLSSSKPPSAPSGMTRPSPLPSMLTVDSRITVAARATTAPPIRSPVQKHVIRSSKLRSSTHSASWSVPCRREGRARADNLRDPFIVQSINPANHRVEHSAPPPSESSVSTIPCHQTSHTADPELPLSPLQTTPYFERCAQYRDPLNTTGGYTPLTEEGSLSETPLLQPAFSSLSSFLSSPDLVK